MEEREELLERIRTSDPSLTKLHLVFAPSAYFDVENHERGLEAFLQLLRDNTSITYVLLERRLARGLSKSDHVRLVQAIFEIPLLKEVEIWSQQLSLPALWSSLTAAKELRKLGLGMVTLTDVPVMPSKDGATISHIPNDDEALTPHPTLETFYLSDFRLLPEVTGNNSNGDNDDDNNDEMKPKLDPVLEVLGHCPSLTRVEIFSFPEERPCITSVWPLFRATPNLTHVTLRRLHLPASAVVISSQQSAVAINPLRVLDIGENPLGDDGCASLLRHLSNTQSLWRTTLRELNLKSTLCTTDLSTVLWETLSEPLTLEKLNLASNILRDDGARVLARLLELPTFALQHLEVARCHITNVGATALAHALTRNSSLRVLGLAYNKMNNESYVAFSKALARDNKALQSINLQVDRKLIQTSGCMALQEMCRENTTLRDVSTLLNMTVASAQAKYGNRIRMYLRLNQAGRAVVADNTATLAEWVQLLATVQDDLFAIHFLVRTYPHYAALAAQHLRCSEQGRQLEAPFGGLGCQEAQQRAQDESKRRGQAEAQTAVTKARQDAEANRMTLS